MARIRSVKPELRRDLTVAEWPRDARYAWVLLWGYLDDHGRGHDDMRLLVADLFPLDRDVTERKLDGWLRLMTASGAGTPPLCRYEVGGRRYLHAPKWTSSQKVSHPQRSTIPSCPVHEQGETDSRSIPESLANETGSAPEPFRPSRTPEDLGSKGARDQGAREQGPVGDGQAASAVDALFETWWQVYPRREAKAAAAKAYAKAIRQTDPELILAAAERFRDDPNREPGYTPHAASWLNAGRWDDEPLPARMPDRRAVGDGRASFTEAEYLAPSFFDQAEARRAARNGGAA